MTEQNLITLETLDDRLQLDATTARLVSFRRKTVPDQEFIAPGDADPVFILQYLDKARQFRQLTSADAGRSSVDCQRSTAEDGAITTTVVARFEKLAGLDLDVTVRVQTISDRPFSRWSLTLQNRADLEITDIQFPMVILSYQLAGEPGSEALIWPVGAGKLIRAPQPHQLQPDSPHAWQMRPENSNVLHYPGFTVAQFLAFYNDRAGIYVSCQDTTGLIKQIRPVHHGQGLRLGFSHVGDWPRQGERTLEYDIVIGSFTGDWYAAADIYRQWSREQPWTQTPLTERDDVPDWLLDSPPHIIVRLQGELDLGPAEPKSEFLPYPKTIPLLEGIAEQTDSPLVAVLMSWERGGPWVYPDCFPPAGGSESLREFTELARERGWHVGTFCNGTRWVIAHFWSGYDGEAYFNEHNGILTVSRTHDNRLWQQEWDSVWRPSYSCCLGVAQTQQIAVEFVRTIIDLGLDWIQFFDQNVGCATFPCFSEEHGHPSVPGRWMTTEMEALIAAFKAEATRARADSNHDRQIVFSVEGPVNEYMMPHFQICDIRVVPPEHHASHWLWTDSVPLYHFLYHEYILIQGGFGHGADPHHLAIRNAYNLVVGEIPGAVMKGDGRLLNKDSPGINWAPWEPQVGDNKEALAVLQSATSLRRGAGKPYLVYGRMLAPADVECSIRRWQYDGFDHQIPAIFHAAWEAPDGRVGLVLANWTAEPQQATLSDARLGSAATHQVSTPEGSSPATLTEVGDSLSVTLPPWSCSLVEAAGHEEKSMG